jgi:Spy/CpxP family protein refolding chaperone
VSRILSQTLSISHAWRETMKQIALTAFVLGIILLGCALAQQGAASAAVSDQDLNLLRKDLRSDQKQIIAANMLLTEAEAQKFWPLYDEYTAAKTNINDTKLSVIKDYAANFEKLTDNQAQALVNRWAEADQSALQLRTKYIPLFEKVLTGKKAARFFQIDRRISSLVDLQLSSQIPLVEP